MAGPDLSPRTEFFRGAGGSLVPIPEGMTLEQAMDQHQNFINTHPKVKGEILGKLQQRDVAFGADNVPTREARLANFASQVGAGVEAGDIENFLVRSDLAMSDLPAEKQLKMERHYPDSEVTMVNDLDGSPVLLYRHQGDAMWREVEAPDFTVGDIGALGGMSPELLGEAAAFIGSRGASLVKLMMRAAGGAGGGEVVKSAFDQLRGLELSTTPERTERVLMSSATAATGVLVADPIARVWNTITGSRSVFTPIPEANRAIAGGQRAGLPPLMPGQINPLLESIEQQATGTSLAMKEAERDLFAVTLTKLGSLRDELGDFRDMPDSVLNEVIEKAEKQVKSTIHTNPLITWATAGKGVKKGFENMQELLATREGRNYREAFEDSMDLRYNQESAQMVAASIKFEVVNPALRMKDIDTTFNVPLIIIRNPEFRKAINRLLNRPAEVLVSKGGASPLEQLIRDRTHFFNLKNSDKLTGDERVGATIIHRALSEVMRRPRNLRGSKGNLKPSVERSWRKAAASTTSRERFMGTSWARMIATSDTPSALAEKLTLSQPEIVQGVKRTLMASGQRDKWIAVQQAYKNKMLKDPATMRNIITRAEDKNALDSLLDPRDQQALVKISDEWAALENSQIKQMMQWSVDKGKRAVQLVEEGTRREIKSFIEGVGGKSSPRGRALQAGVIESIIQKSKLPLDEGKFLFRKEDFLREFAKFRDRGILEEVFHPNTLKRIEEDFELYISFLPRKMGQGEGMQKAQAAAGIAKLPIAPLRPDAVLGGASTIGVNKFWSWMFITPSTNKFLMGKGGKAVGKLAQESVGIDKLRLMGAVLATVAENMKEMSNTGSFDILGEDLVPDFF